MLTLQNLLTFMCLKNTFILDILWARQFLHCSKVVKLKITTQFLTFICKKKMISLMLYKKTS